MAPYRILSTSDEGAWHSYLDGVPRKELVHFPRYSRVYERYGDGKAECFVYEAEDGLVLYPFIRRDIAGADLTDIATPYGYGGIAYASPPGQAARLIGDFRGAFVDYARATHTVSEFVRFHPFLENHAHLHGLMDEVVLCCRNALIDLSVGPEALFALYRKSYQQCIRKAERFGLTVEPLEGADFVDHFFDLYNASMLRKRQEGYLRFRRVFLVHLWEELGANLRCFAARRGDEILAVALFLHHDRYVDYFLAASRPETLSFHPNHLLLHRVALWAIDQGAAWFHLGGGHESLQFFKNGFANDTRGYYIGKHVFEPEEYARLSADHWAQHGRRWTPGHPYFPGYRAEFPEEETADP